MLSEACSTKGITLFLFSTFLGHVLKLVSKLDLKYGYFRTMSQKCLKKHSTNAIKFRYKITNKIANMQEDSVFYAKKVKKSEEFYEKRDLGRENGGKNEKYRRL